MKRKLLTLFLTACMLSCVMILPSTAEQLSYGTSMFAEDAKLVKSGYFGEAITFCENDFKQALGAKKISSITITELPEESSGSLFLASVRVCRGQNIAASVIDLLKFVPASTTVSEASFRFTADNLAGGAEIPCQIRLLDKKNQAPTVTNDNSLSVATQKGISYFGTMGASDPDGDALYFRVTAYPKHGTLTVLDSANGEYRYTPTSNYTGKDKFSYVVRDEYGNYSGVQTVSIQISKRSSSLVYQDVAGTKAELAAIALTDAGIVMGRLSGDGMYFDPDQEVSRGDFTVMAMKAAGIVPQEGITQTVFDDDAAIPTSIKDYIATAQKEGYVNGTFDGTGLYFAPDRAITRAEAAVIVCKVMQLTLMDSTAVFAGEDDVPVWAESAVATLYTMGIMAQEEAYTWNATDPLTRADAAMMLYALMQ